MTSPVVAVIGGGQLARMMAPAATALGITLKVLVESPHAAAALPSHLTVVGMPTDDAAVAALLSEPVPEVVTWEHEHIPASVFAMAARQGIPARPGLAALLYAQDKIEMRTRMDLLGLPNPPWSEVKRPSEVNAFLDLHGGTAVAKTARGGYDGRGVRVINDASAIDDWLSLAAEGGPRVLLEAKVPFVRELAALVARSPSGSVATYPVVESVQRDGMCAEVTAPAQGLAAGREAEIRSLAVTIAEALDVTGVLAVELFDVGDAVLVNELAMRPHNSGHWTIEGSVTSQFEQHLRAVLDLPLGATDALAPVAVMANIIGGPRRQLSGALRELEDPHAKVHLYGKEVRDGRKLGHVTVLGGDQDEVRRRAVATARMVSHGGET